LEENKKTIDSKNEDDDVASKILPVMIGDNDDDEDYVVAL